MGRTSNRGRHRKRIRRPRDVKANKCTPVNCKNNDDYHVQALHGVLAVHSTCRIDWVIYTIRQYYQYRGYVETLNKERRKVEYLSSSAVNLEYKCQEVQTHDANHLKVLDVGSFNNPFAKFIDLDITAIDIRPAHKSVKQCDFLDLEVHTDHFPEVVTDWNSSSSITSAPGQYFDVIIFSLLLHDISSPRQRLFACKKAYSLLKTGGILCIITPDENTNESKHICKLWKISLGFLGFSRIKYERIRLEFAYFAMTFRKGICPAVWAKDAERDLFNTKKRKDTILIKKFGNFDYDNIRNEIYLTKDFEENEEHCKEPVKDAKKNEELVEHNVNKEFHGENSRSSINEEFHEESSISSITEESRGESSRISIHNEFQGESSSSSIDETHEIKEASEDYLRIFLSSLERDIISMDNKHSISTNDKDTFIIKKKRNRSRRNKVEPYS
ncbi:unnamed protein product, partial [Meganyctiphanes norvegica]